MSLASVMEGELKEDFVMKLLWIYKSMMPLTSVMEVELKEDFVKEIVAFRNLHNNVVVI